MSDPGRASYTLHVVSTLHREREGLISLQATRLALVRTMDSLLALFERDPRYRHLMLNGETVSIDDYLAFRPEQYETIEALVQEGRLLMGPWFIQTDSMLVHPESLIRNLLMGTGTAQMFGAVMRIAYMSEGSGHLAQFPQLLRGFGIAAAVVTRGIDSSAAELFWEAPDGSRVLLANPTKLAAQPWLDIASQRDLIAANAASGHLLTLSHETAELAEILPERVIRPLIESLPDTVFHSTLPDYIDAIRNTPDLPIVHGELRSPHYQLVGQGCLSSVLWVKHQNQQAETFLTRWVEPFTAWAELMRAEPLRPQTMLRQLWRLLLENQAAGLLAGRIAPATEQDMQTRYRHIEQLSDALLADAFAAFAPAADKNSDSGILVFNPSNTPRSDILVLDNSNEWLVPVQDIPPLGYALLPYHTERSQRLQPQLSDLTIENEYLRAKVDSAGPTLILTDKQRDMTYYRLMIIRSEGDQGDIANFEPVGRGIQNARDLNHDGLYSVRTPLYEVLHYSIQLTLDPAPEMEPPPTTAEKNLVLLPVNIQLSLARGARRLDVRVTVPNSVKNHRVRVHFPMPFPIRTVVVDEAFQVGEYEPEDLPPMAPPEGWAETPLGTRPVQAFIGTLNPEAPHNGLLIANRGLPEAEIVTNEDDQMELTLTLLRSVGYINKTGVSVRSRDPLPADIRSERTAMMGDCSAEFSLIPTSRETLQDEMNEAWAYAEGPLRWQLVEGVRTEQRASIIRVSDSRFRLSAVKLPDDPAKGGLIVRGYNLTGQDVTVRLTPFRKFAICDVVRMDETELGAKLAVEAGGDVEFVAAPRRVLTFWLHD